MTTQELFDKMALHLLSQNERSESHDYYPRCKYRMGVLRCAIGCLIPDHKYHDDMEGQDIGELSDSIEDSIGRELDSSEWYLLQEMQHVHDSDSIPLWGENIERVAAKFDLEINSAVQDAIAEHAKKHDGDSE